MELTAIPGVGEKTATALAELPDPEMSLEAGDVATIAKAPGIPPARAARIVRDAIRHRHGESEDFLATDRAQEIASELIALLQSHAVTDYGAHRLSTFYPSTVQSRIEEARTITREALELDIDPSVDHALNGLSTLDDPSGIRVRERCIATRDAERYTVAKKAVPELSIEIIENEESLADLARGYATVYVIDEVYAGLDLPEEVEVRPDALETPAVVIPERVLTFFGQNRSTIRAAIDVHRHANLSPPTDLESLEALLERIDDDGSPVEDAQIRRLDAAISDLGACVRMAETVANDHLRSAIRDQGVTIAGDDLLSLVEQGAGINTVLERELDTEFSEAIRKARAHFIDSLGLTDGERIFVDDIIPDIPRFPVEHNEAALAALSDELQATHDRRAATIKRDLAADLLEERSAVESLVREALELDVRLAITRFATAHDCTMPDIGGTGIAITGGRSPLLALPPDAVEPVDYTVDNVVVLSGVNSGGKTAMLDLIAAITILAHMGLPVPADAARVQRFDALHYHAATQGTLDAGAFESTLRQFASLVADPDGCLVLVDELESITEPGAAATIVAGVLADLEHAATAVFVSHLAAEIREAAGPDLRIDGIVANGIEDGELVVNRTPVRDHLARSTPELIVEGLAETADAERADFYFRLLERFGRSPSAERVK